MVKIYGALSPEEREIREEVFMREQGFSSEFDELDGDGGARHIVLFEDGKAAGVCRVYPGANYGEFNAGADFGEFNAGADFGEFNVGRVAVRKEFRGRHLGERLMEEAERLIIAEGGTVSVVSAQKQAERFYAKCGYVSEGEVYLDEFCPHIKMRKRLGE